MKIAFNPSTVAALTTPPNNKDITFDLRGQNIFARGVKFCGTDTNTWRDIKINNVSIGSHTLDLRNGSNTTLTNTNGVVTINSTWRPVVDNLTSNSATSSLSANQGRVLAGLINGKSDSDHNHDGRYLKLTGGTLTGNLIGTSAMFSGRFYGNGDDEGIIIKPSSNGFAGLILGTHDGERSVFYFVKNKPFWRYSHGSDNLDIIHPKKSGTIALTSDIPNKNSWNYDDRYLKLTGGTMLLGEGLKFHANDNYFGAYADARIISLLDDNDKICDGGLIIDERATLDGKEYVTELLRIRDSEFKWRGADILHSGNYSGILDSRYYTESEVNSLLSKKLDRVNLSVGSWNPRGYNLAADYSYNGGDLSISESGSQIHVSVDGYFWQNEGRYRVLDTSNVAELKGNLTVNQYLSSTDAAWWPLIWGGSSHNNTSNSTGAVYKSYDKLSWQTSSQTLYATNIQTENIKHLSIGGGIYWNSNVESATDSSDAASITLVKSGVAGGTTLVLSQMNDANDTIQFKTNGSARLYHNSYPILTTQNTYVSNNKGYINGTEITQVNNADNAYHLRINSANTWSTWYWAGQSGQPSWLWGSNDGTNMYVWNPNNFNVNTAQYLRSLGNQNCQTGRTQNYGDVYSYNTYSNNTGSPTTYASVIGFGRGIGGTVEIAGGWCDTNLYWRSLRDCCEDWHSWRTVLDSNNYTDFIGSYYWANVKISTSSSTTTSPTVSNLTATNSIRMSNISLEHTDEINNITNNGGINLNYRNSGNISLCQGGGNVGIGTMSPSYKLDVKGQVKASGFIHSDHSINDAVLLAGGGYGRIFMLGTKRYYNNTSYELSFHKLSNLCNNLVWVDGCIWNSTSISFQLSSDFYPYPYANSPSMRTIYRMDGNNMITVDGNGIVIISCSSYPRRVGFFYTGRA